MSTDPTGAPGGPGAAGGAPGQPSEEELRAAYEAELSRITSADMMLQAAVSLLNIGSYRLARGRRPPAREALPRPAAGATWSRCATRSTASGRCWRSSSAASPVSSARCATRSRSCRWPTRARCRRAVASRPPARRDRAERAPSRRAAAPRPSRRRPGHGEAPGRAPGPWPGRVQRAAVGARALSACGAASPPAFPNAGDRLRARLHRVGARPEQPGRQMCARRSSRGTPIRPRRIFC